MGSCAVRRAAAVKDRRGRSAVGMLSRLAIWLNRADGIAVDSVALVGSGGAQCVARPTQTA
ncbi:hypothetical protein SBBP2_910007 [Burkholderiales bacterium]|nr:hypothetical protein SBBP2_910007 [Burkholderiales bacterium]